MSLSDMWVSADEADRKPIPNDLIGLNKADGQNMMKRK